MREIQNTSFAPSSGESSPFPTASIDKFSIKTGNLFLKKRDQYHKIKIENILCIQAQGDYTLLSTAQDNYMSNYTLNELEQLFAQYNFLKIHRSYLININEVTAIHPKNNMVILGQLSIPISRSMKSNFMDQFNFM